MPVASVSTMGTPVPYITLAELRRSPIQNQLRKLVPNSSPADNDAELERIIVRVSAMINGEVNQNLAATVDQEVAQVRVSADGDLRLHCRCNPIIKVLSVSVGPDPYSLSPVSDLSYVVLDPWRITIPRGAGNWRPGARLWVQWSYVNGFPVTTIADDIVAGDTTITVRDATGIEPNKTILTVEDGIHLETVVPTAVDGNSLTVPGLMFAHKADVGIHALPGDIKEATLLLISRLHDTWSLTMGAITSDGSGATNHTPRPRIMCDAASILNPYKRTW